jgi:hypothetical protein
MNRRMTSQNFSAASGDALKSWLLHLPRRQPPGVLDQIHVHDRFAPEDTGLYRQKIQPREALLKSSELRLGPLVARQPFPHRLDRVEEHRVTQHHMGNEPGLLLGRIRQSERQLHVGKRCIPCLVLTRHGAQANTRTRSLRLCEWAKSGEIAQLIACEWVQGRSAAARASSSKTASNLLKASKTSRAGACGSGATGNWGSAGLVTKRFDLTDHWEVS